MIIPWGKLWRSRTVRKWIRAASVGIAASILVLMLHDVLTLLGAGAAAKSIADEITTALEALKADNLASEFLEAYGRVLKWPDCVTLQRVVNAQACIAEVKDRFGKTYICSGIHNDDLLSHQHSLLLYRAPSEARSYCSAVAQCGPIVGTCPRWTDFTSFFVGKDAGFNFINVVFGVPFAFLVVLKNIFFQSWTRSIFNVIQLFIGYVVVRDTVEVVEAVIGERLRGWFNVVFRIVGALMLGTLFAFVVLLIANFLFAGIANAFSKDEVVTALWAGTATSGLHASIGRWVEATLHHRLEGILGRWAKWSMGA